MSVNIANLAVDALVGIVVSVVLASVPLMRWWLLKRRARKLWPIQASRVAVVLSTSAATDTGKYIRTASGIGQVRALAIIVPSIYRAWRGRLDVSHVLLSENVTTEWTRDLIVLGGPKNNQVTDQILKKFQRAASSHPGWPVVTQVNSTIFWSGIEYEAEVCQDGSIAEDFGLILRWRNPFNERMSLVMLAGASTFGTIAASMWYCGENRPSEDTASKDLKDAPHFIALVRADVRNGHVAIPSLVQGVSLD